MLCYDILSYLILCYYMLCYLIISYLMLLYVMLCYVMLCYAILSYLIWSHVIICYLILSYLILCYFMLCYVMLCYDILSQCFAQPPPQPPQPPPPQTSVIMGICLCLVTSTFIFVHIHNGLCILSKNIISVHLYTGLRGLGFVIRKWPTKTAIHLHKLKFHLAKHMSIYTKHKIYVNFTVCICRSILFLCIYTLKKTAVFNNWQPLQHFWKTSKKWLHTLIYQKTLLGFGAPTACLVTKQRQMGVRGDSAKILPMGLAPKT